MLVGRTSPGRDEVAVALSCVLRSATTLFGLARNTYTCYGKQIARVVECADGSWRVGAVGIETGRCSPASWSRAA
jgi:hypothetical protein